MRPTWGAAGSLALPVCRGPPLARWVRPEAPEPWGQQKLPGAASPQLRPLAPARNRGSAAGSRAPAGLVRESRPTAGPIESPLPVCRTRSRQTSGSVFGKHANRGLLEVNARIRLLCKRAANDCLPSFYPSLLQFSGSRCSHLGCFRCVPK